MKHIPTLIIYLLLTINSLKAQNVRFINQGVIEFERSVNTHAILKKMLGNQGSSIASDAYEHYKSSQPQFKKLVSTLHFAENKTLFSPIATETTGISFIQIPFGTQDNITYTDLNTGLFTTQKKFFEETFLLKDTVRKINWKLTTEMRNIAGYECRRANAIVADSIYIVAFYTDKIPVSGGPESFTGLPGMILGLAMPHEHVTWFATKITDRPVSPNELKAPAKGKPKDLKGLKEAIGNFAAKSGNWGKPLLKTLIL
ncbi:GLPGLI family protein [Pedobacter sp. ok626]|uniref:GLPGLI family protein n=1 Tax=Pedobacter sp. ok626 TaxID=1761882 RepID=UPI000883C47F|nr:GLPGLI family protein [Pedobacter sp. ok626]SDK31990.1 GLPGLI family protein [Pedobacter sp. ok626]